MTTTVVFVHGITVREQRYERMLRRIRYGLCLSRDDVVVAGCYWGDLATPPDFRGVSIPSARRGTRGPDGPDPDPSWWEDPLGGLRDLRDAEDLQPLHGLARMPEPIARRNDALVAVRQDVGERLVAALPDIVGPDRAVPGPTVFRIVADVLEEAMRADRDLTPAALADPVADAVAASLFAVVAGEVGVDPEFGWNAAADAVRGAFVDRFGSERAALRVRARALTAGLRWGGRRYAMSRMAAGVGDVLVHAAHRTEILARLDEQVRRVPADHRLVIVGHSLGGVISFEYARDCDRVIHRLVTVGSQVGLFAELGVYGPQPAGPGAQTWVNVYDPDDALAFLAAPLFDDVTDVELDTRAPFPVCHSEYWAVAATYGHVLGPV